MTRGRITRGLITRGAWKKREFTYIPPYFYTKFEGYLFKIYGRTGYLKFQYSAETGLKLFSELIFSFAENGCEKCSFSMIVKPETLGFKVEDNDMVEIYIYNGDSPAWSGVINNPGNEYRTEGIYQFSAIGFGPRAKGYLVEDSWAVETVGNIAADLASQIQAKDPRQNYDSARINPVATTLTTYKIDRKNALEAFNKLGTIAGDTVFRILGDRYVAFDEISVDLVPSAVFHADSKNVKIGKIERSATDKIKNIYTLERKAAGGGSVSTTGNSGSSTDTAYALDGIIEATESIFMYGEYMAKETIPETVTDADAIKYGIQKCITTAFPTYKIELEVNQNWFNALVIADGKAIVFNQEELFIDTIENCEDSTRWSKTGGAAFAIAESATRYEGRYSIEVSGAAVAGEAAWSLLPETHDFSQVRQLSFWCYCDTPGEVFSVWIGESAYNEENYQVFITEPNRWQYVRILIDLDKDINYFGIEFLANGTYDLKLDLVQKQYLGRRKYDLGIKNVEYTFRSNEEKIKFVLGSNDKPFIDTFVDAWRSVEAQKEIGNTG